MSAAHSKLSPGDVLSRKYEIIRVLGEGGMGIVYEAMHLRLQRRVAIKTILADRVGPELLQRFEREAKVGARLETRHVPTIHDIDTTNDGTVYIVMEMLRGRSLADIAEGTTVGARELLNWMVEVCGVLEKAHAAGIIHRDLKPENIFIVDDMPPFAKVLDFGIAKLTQGEELTAKGAIAGTPMFMPPEQLKAEPIDARADVFALGVTMYVCLCGRFPFDEQAPHGYMMSVLLDEPTDIAQVRPDVPHELAKLVMVAIKKEPAQRFSDAKRMRVAMQEVFATPKVQEWSFRSTSMTSTWRAPRVEMLSPLMPPARDGATQRVDAPPLPPPRDGATNQDAVRPQPPVHVQQSPRHPRTVARSMSGREKLAVAVAICVSALGGLAASGLTRGGGTSSDSENPADHSAQASRPTLPETREYLLKSRPEGCRATIMVGSVPLGAEVLVKVGTAPCDVPAMPKGPQLEFVATADGFVPRRAVIVKNDLAWDEDAHGDWLYQLAMPLETSKTNGTDPWPTGKPGSEVGGSGEPGTVRVVATPTHATIWLFAGVGPLAQFTRSCEQDVEILVAGRTREVLRLTRNYIERSSSPDSSGMRSVRVNTTVD